MELIGTINGYINDFVWGVPCIVLIMGVGLITTIRLKGMQFKNWGFMLKHTYIKAFSKEGRAAGGDGDITSFQAAMVSVSAVVGSGNIAGIATAIVLGGPGAMFWMIVAALVGMATKYAEIGLGVKYREKMPDGSWAGGPMYYIANGMKVKWLGTVFAVLMIFAGFMISAVVDTNTMAAALNEQFGLNPVIVGVIFVVLTGIVIFGGITRIGEVCGLLSPFMAGAYLLCGLFVIVSNIGQLPTAIVQVISGAFNPASVTGGAVGSVFMCMRYGLARGIFSNEAGIGTAAITHASAKVNTPGEQAIWGPMEVFVDTIVVCSISGLTIVMSGLWNTGVDGAALTMRAFSAMLPGNWGSYVVLGAVILFGFSCLISWYNYVEKAGVSMWGPKCKSVLKILWLVFILIGSYTTLGIAWDLADTANGLLIIPNMIAILLLGKEIVKMKNDFYDEELPKYKAGKK